MTTCPHGGHLNRAVDAPNRGCVRKAQKGVCLNWVIRGPHWAEHSNVLTQACSIGIAILATPVRVLAIQVSGMTTHLCIKHDIQVGLQELHSRRLGGRYQESRPPRDQWSSTAVHLRCCCCGNSTRWYWWQIAAFTAMTVPPSARPDLLFP